MIWRPPIWAGSVHSLWRFQALFALCAAGAEAGIGFWLRQIPTLSERTAHEARLWMAGLGFLLAARVVFSWRRDLWREKAALRSGTEFHHGLWTQASTPPLCEDPSWLAREGREGIEAGTRAAAEMRTAVVTLLVLLPVLIWLAPWLAVSVAASAFALGWVAQRRSTAGKLLADEDCRDARTETDAEEWGWRAMPEAVGSGIGPKVASVFQSRGSLHALRRSRRTASLLAWGATGEAAAHAGGWLLAAVSLAVWKLGWLPAGNLAGFLGVSLLAYRPIREAGKLMPHLQRAEQIWNRSRPIPSPHSMETISSNGDLELLDFEGGWDPSKPLFQGVCFHLRAGEIAVVTGPNGCGKSTLLAALAGICPHRFRRLHRPATQCWMAQEPVLPPLPLTDWLGTCNPKVVGLLFPQGLPENLDPQLPLVHGGHNLSRGQRARLALLAIASSKSGLWLLDEPVSALPADQRDQILTQLMELRGNASVILAEPVVPQGLRVEEILWEEPGAKGLCIARVRIS